MVRLSDPQIAGINQFLTEQRPTLDKMLTDARMNLVQLGGGNAAPEPSAREAAILLREVKRQADELLATAKGIKLMKDPFPQPKTLTEFRDLLWDAHVQNNQLINADALVTQGKNLARVEGDRQGEKRLRRGQGPIRHRF